MIKKLARSSVIHFIGLTANKVISTLVFLLFARLLQPTAFGQFTLFITIVTVATVLAEVGLGQWLQTLLTTQRHQLFSSLVGARLLTWLISILTITVINTFTHTFSLLFIAVLSTALLFEAFLSFADSYYLAEQQTPRIALKNSLRFLIVLVGLVLTRSFFSVEVAVLLYVAGSVLSCLFYFPWKLIDLSKILPTTESFSLMGKSLPYAVLVMTSLTYARGDSLLVQFLKGNQALGLYGAAYRYLEGISLLPSAVFQVLFPHLAQAKTLSLKSLQMIFFSMLGFGAVTGATLNFFAPFLTTHLLGTAYSPALPIVQTFSLVVVLFFMNAPLSALIQSSSLLKKFLPFGIANTVLNLVLNCILIPRFGIQGAAWSMLITEITGFVINAAFVYQFYQSGKHS